MSSYFGHSAVLQARSAIRPQPKQQRGFVLIVVFLLIILMVGVATTLMLSSQADLQVAGQDRETTSAFYAAETGAAFAKDWLLSTSPLPGASTWTAIYKSGVKQLCVQPIALVYQPGTVPNVALGQVPIAFSSGGIGGTTFNFCVHNNGLDPAWGGGAGATTDSDGIIAIEAYGYGPSGQVSHITVEVQSAGIAANKSGGYAFAGDKQGNGEGGVAVGGVLTQGL